MSARSPDTSSISFTALYTGHVWYANGLSAPAFHTRRGSVFYHALAPFEYVGGKLAGGNIRTFLLQRHHLIDHLVRDAIEQRGVRQVLEIACGLSPRGYRFRQQYPDLKYVEADLPDMAARKHRLLSAQQCLNDMHRVVPLNIFSSDGVDAMETIADKCFDRSQPLLVITEGLVNYFSLESISPFWQRLQEMLAGYAGGTYLTDNYPLFHDHPFHRTMKTLGGMLGAASRSQVSFHFGSDQETSSHFSELGFASVTVHNPKDFYQQLPIPQSRGNPFVRVIEART
ncbi:MAG: class I SAM-dependent methyltransferase [Alcanivoracaceae bacterium]|jgi:O-methyltransferase involved in polyketide biosynthesis|nr:class I SAM-dependent methyltransferase [Alcanivoracaceae bacterium]